MSPFGYFSEGKTVIACIADAIQSKGESVQISSRALSLSVWGRAAEARHPRSWWSRRGSDGARSSLESFPSVWDRGVKKASQHMRHLSPKDLISRRSNRYCRREVIEVLKSCVCSMGSEVHKQFQEGST